MNNSISIAVIGCGRVAQHYKKIFDSGVLSDWCLVGFYDILIKRSTYFSEHFKTKSYESFESMLEATRPDLVLILTPSGLHYQHTKIALQRNCNVLCVKNPLQCCPHRQKNLKTLHMKIN